MSKPKTPTAHKSSHGPSLVENLHMYSLPVGNMIADGSAGMASQEKHKKQVTESEGAARRRKRLETEQKNLEQMMEAICCLDPSYEIPPNSPIKPLCDFYANLVRKSGDVAEGTEKLTVTRLPLRVPVTVVYGVDEGTIMYYTSQEGMLCRLDNVPNRIILQSLGDFEDENAACCVMKRPMFGERQATNDISIMNTKQLRISLENPGHGIFVIQKFIRCKGPKASVTRLVSSPTRAPYAWNISSNRLFDEPAVVGQERDLRKLYTTCSDTPQSLSIFKMIGKLCEGVDSSVRQLMRYVEGHVRPRVHFDEFVADFIRDEKGVWWFIQAKAFKCQVVEDPPHSPPTGASSTIKSGSGGSGSRPSYMHVVTCKACLEGFHPDELSYTMTLKMIYDMENHMKRRGVRLAWFNRPEFKTMSTSALWYQTFRVCKKCIEMYQNEQHVARAEAQFATSIGVPIDAQKILEHRESTFVEFRNKANMAKKRMEEQEYGGRKSPSRSPPRRPASAMAKLTSASSLNSTTNSSGLKTPLSISRPSSAASTPLCSPRASAKLKQIAALEEVEKLMNLYRMAIFMHEVRDLPPLYECEDLHLEIHVFNTITKFPLVINNGTDFIPINKMRVFHFFVHQSENALRRFVETQQRIGVHLMRGREPMGSAFLSLQQFASGIVDKLDFTTIFSSSILKMCTVRVAVGFLAGRAVDTTDLVLHEVNRAWVPVDAAYFTADPLTDEWLALRDKQFEHEKANEQREKEAAAASVGSPQTRPSTASRVSYAPTAGTDGGGGGGGGGDADLDDVDIPEDCDETFDDRQLETSTLLKPPKPPRQTTTVSSASVAGASTAWRPTSANKNPRPSSARPASARPASAGRPNSARLSIRPASAAAGPTTTTAQPRPSSAAAPRPSSARPSSAKRPASATIKNKDTTSAYAGAKDPMTWLYGQQQCTVSTGVPAGVFYNSNDPHARPPSAQKRTEVSFLCRTRSSSNASSIAVPSISITQPNIRTPTASAPKSPAAVRAGRAAQPQLTESSLLHLDNLDDHDFEDYKPSPEMQELLNRVSAVSLQPMRLTTNPGARAATPSRSPSSLSDRTGTPTPGRKDGLPPSRPSSSLSMISQSSAASGGGGGSGSGPTPPPAPAGMSLKNRLQARMASALSEKAIGEEVFCIHIQIGTAYNFATNVDETWQVSYTLMKKKIASETFQMFDDPHLILDHDECIYVLCKERSLQAFLDSLPQMTVTISPKFENKRTRAGYARVDLKPLAKLKRVDQCFRLFREGSAEEEDLVVDGDKFIVTRGSDAPHFHLVVELDQITGKKRGMFAQHTNEMPQGLTTDFALTPELMMLKGKPLGGAPGAQSSAAASSGLGPSLVAAMSLARSKSPKP